MTEKTVFSKVGEKDVTRDADIRRGDELHERILHLYPQVAFLSREPDGGRSLGVPLPVSASLSSTVVQRIVTFRRTRGDRRRRGAP